MVDVNFDTMSDEDFLNSSVPAPTDKEDYSHPESTGSTLEDRLGSPVEEEAPSSAPAEEDEGSSKEESHTTPKQTKAEETPAVAEEGAEEEDEDDASQSEQDDEAFSGDAPKKKDPDPAEAESAKSEAAAEDEGAAADGKDGDKAPIDYKQEYEKLLAPFKANGREFKVNSPDEAVRLMQMGANYTKKMQSLAPNLKLMKMLDNNDLLTEDQVSYMIDLAQKKPDAIQKLLHESKIDPLEIDASEPGNYQKGNHSVSDEEMAFHDVLGDVTQTSGGKETVQHIDKTWDQASKAAVFKEPTILAIINQQRENGVYDTITAEIDRQKTLGIIPNNTPFLEAYKLAGDKLQSENAFAPKEPETPQTPADTEAPQVIETRTATRKPTVANGEKAKAASPAKSTAKTPPQSFNPFEMSDEQIMAITSPQG